MIWRPNRRHVGWIGRREGTVRAGRWSLRVSIQRRANRRRPVSPSEAHARFQRRISHLERIALGHAEKCERVKSEVKRLEDTLAWVHRKLTVELASTDDAETADAVLRKIEAVIREVIPRRLARSEAVRMKDSLRFGDRTRDLQDKRGNHGGGGNRTRETSPPPQSPLARACNRGPRLMGRVSFRNNFYAA